MDMNAAKQLLVEEDLTCVLFRNEEVYTSKDRGVKPLLQFRESISSCKGFTAVDKVVGKAAAFLYLLLEVDTIHAGVISRPALQVLLENQVTVTYDRLAEYIENRTKDGKCPMESAVWNIDDAGEALAVIQEKIEELKGGKKHE